MENVDQETLEDALSALDEAEQMEQQGLWDKALYKYNIALNNFGKCGLPAKKSREITDKITDRISEINQYLQAQKAQQQQSTMSAAECAQQEKIGIAALDEANLLVQRGSYGDAMEKYMVAAQALMQAGWGEKELLMIQKEVEKVQKIMSGDTSASQQKEEEYFSPGMSQPDVVYSGNKKFGSTANTTQANEEYVPSFLQAGAQQHDIIQGGMGGTQAPGQEEYVPSFLMGEANKQPSYGQYQKPNMGEAQQIYTPSFAQYDQSQQIPNQYSNQAVAKTPEEYIPTFLQTQQNVPLAQAKSHCYDADSAQIFNPSIDQLKSDIYQPNIYQPKQQPQEYVPSFLQTGQSDIVNQQNFFIPSQQQSEYTPTFLSAQPVSFNQSQPVRSSTNEAIDLSQPMFAKSGQQDYVPYQSKQGAIDMNEPMYAKVGQQDYVPYQAKPESISANEPMFAKAGQQDYVPYQAKPESISANEPMYAKVGQQDYVPYQAKPESISANEPMFAKAGQQDYVPYQAKQTGMVDTNEPMYTKAGQQDYVPYQAKPESISANEPMYAKVGQQDYVPYQAKPESISANEPMYAKVGQQDYVPYQSKQGIVDTNEPMYAKVGQQDYVPYQAKPESISANEPMFAKVGQQDYVPYQAKTESISANEPMYAKVGQQDYVPYQSKQGIVDTNEPMYAKVGQQDYVPYQAKKETIAENEPMFAKIGQQDYLPYQAKQVVITPPNVNMQQTSSSNIPQQRAPAESTPVQIRRFQYNDLMNEKRKTIDGLKEKTKTVLSQFVSQKDEIMGMIEQSLESLDKCFSLLNNGDFVKSIESMEEAIDIFNSVPGWGDIVLRCYQLIDFLQLKYNLIISNQLATQSAVLDSSPAKYIKTKEDIISKKLSETNNVLMQIETLISTGLTQIEAENYREAIKVFNKVILALTSIGWESQTHTMQLIVNDLNTLNNIFTATLLSVGADTSTQATINQKRAEQIRYMENQQIKALGNESSAFTLLKETQSALEILDYDSAIKKFENVLNQFIEFNQLQLVATLFNARNMLLSQKYKTIRENTRISAKLSQILQLFKDLITKATSDLTATPVMKELTPSLFNSMSLFISGAISDGLTKIINIEKNASALNDNLKTMLKEIIKESTEINQINTQLLNENKALKETLRKQLNSFIEMLEKETQNLKMQESAKLQQLISFQSGVSSQATAGASQPQNAQVQQQLSQMKASAPQPQSSSAPSQKPPASSEPTRENILANIQALMGKTKSGASSSSSPASSVPQSQPQNPPKLEPKKLSDRDSLLGSIRDSLKVVDRNVEKQEQQKKQKEVEDAKKQKEKEEFQKMMDKLRGGK